MAPKPHPSAKSSHPPPVKTAPNSHTYRPQVLFNFDYQKSLLFHCYPFFFFLRFLSLFRFFLCLLPLHFSLFSLFLPPRKPPSSHTPPPSLSYAIQALEPNGARNTLMKDLVLNATQEGICCLNTNETQKRPDQPIGDITPRQGPHPPLA